MRHLRLACAASAAALLASAAAARAGSLVDDIGARALALGESMRADARGSMAPGLNPAGLALGSQLVFEGSFGVGPEDGAKEIGASACDATVPNPGCFYYHYTTAQTNMAGVKSSWSTHEFGVTLSRALGRALTVGINSKYFDYNTDMTGQSGSSGFAFDGGLVLRPTQTINLAVVGYNLVSADSAEYPRAFATGISARPFSSVGISADAVWNLQSGSGSSGRYGGGIEYFLSSSNQQSGFPLRAGVVYDAAQGTTYATAGLGFLNKQVGLDIGLRKQIGGSDLLVIGSLRLFGPQVRHQPRFASTTP